MTDAIQESDRRDLEQIWDARLQYARRRYFRAAAEFHRHLLERGKEPSDELDIAIRRAEAEAFADYCRVLATFTELAANGKLPDEDRSNLTVMPRRAV